MRALEQARRRFQQAFHSAPTGHGARPPRRLDDPRRQPLARRDAAPPGRRPRRAQHPRDHPPRRPAGGGRLPGPARARASPTPTCSTSATCAATASSSGPARASPSPRTRACRWRSPTSRTSPSSGAPPSSCVGGDPRRPDRAAQPHRAARPGRRHPRRAPRSATSPLLFIDLDNFKAVNDSLGHGIGDTLLTAMSRAARATSSATDAVLARFGGDEFIVVLRARARPSTRWSVAEAAARGDRARRSTSRAPSCSSRRASACSVNDRDGDDGRRPAARRRRGDVPGQGARPRLRRGVRPGHPRDDGARPAHGDRAAPRPRARRDRALLPADRRADDRPRRRVRGARPLAAPRARPAGARPVPAAGRGDRARSTRSATSILARRARPVRPVAGARPAVRRRHLVGQRRHPPGRRPGVRRARRRPARPRPGIPADSLWLEITETALLADVKASTVALRNLRSLGLHLAVDDFGTGYSSLTYLKRFPVEAIKIDRGFVAGLGLDTEDTTIVEAVVNLGHSFGIAVIAEGLETPLQLARLRDDGLRPRPGLPVRPPPPGVDRRDASATECRSAEAGLGRTDDPLTDRPSRIGEQAGSAEPLPPHAAEDVPDQEPCLRTLTTSVVGTADSPLTPSSWKPRRGSWSGRGRRAARRPCAGPRRSGGSACPCRSARRRRTGGRAPARTARRA